MTKDILYTINVSLDAYSVMISLIIAGSIILYKNVEKYVKWFAITNLAAVLYGISDIFMWISEGTDAKWKFIALPVSSFVFFLSGILIFMSYIKFIIEYYGKTERISKNYMRFCIAASCIYVISLILTPFLDLFYVILPDNVYQRGKYFNITIFVEVLLYLEALFIVIKNHKKFSGAENIGFASFIFVPFIMQIVQIAHYGLALNSLGLTISFFIIFITMNQKIKENFEAQNNSLQKKEKRYIDFQHTTIMNLSTLIETRDISESKHIIRITKYVKLMAQQCMEDGYFSDTINDRFVVMLERTSPLHDIGNIKIPDSILNKPGRVTPEEHTIIEKHAIEGSKIVNEVLPIGVDREMIKMANNICKSHHEKWNGRGYPEHLSGDDIPLCARFMAVADVFDALVTDRCYKKNVTTEEAFEIMEKEAGEHFDPIIIKEFLKIKNKILEINEKYADHSYEGK